MAYNSTIKRKKCKCSKSCKLYPSIGYAGYASSHAPKEITDKVGSKKKLAQKNKNARNKVRMLLPKNEDKNLQELWFSMVAQEIKKHPYCWETGEWIPENYYRHASAHILNKKDFPSVSTHPLNFLILSAGSGAHDKTHRLDTFSNMKVWPIAVERFKEMEPYIKERHKLLNQFRELVYKTTDQLKNTLQ